MQVRASGTPLIPTRKIVDFLGIRAAGGKGGLIHPLAWQQRDIDRGGVRQEKS